VEEEGHINSGPRSKKLYREFLRWPEFIFPLPHPSLKVPYPQGVVSYNHLGSTLHDMRNRDTISLSLIVS